MQFKAGAPPAFFSPGDPMRYPNLRYGSPDELRYFAMGIPPRDLAYRLRRDERTVKDWLQGRKKIPWWVPEILRLQHMEHHERVRQMGIYKIAPRLGIVSGDVIALATRPAASEPAQDAPQAVTDPYQTRAATMAG